MADGEPTARSQLAPRGNQHVHSVYQQHDAALAQGAARVHDSARAKRYLGVTALIGVLFLVIKGFEYAGDFREGLHAWRSPFSGASTI